MCGWRPTQEDTEILMVPLDTEESGLFAVFDGHGSDFISTFCMNYFPQELLKNSDYIEGRYKEALKAVFIRMDEIILSDVGRRIIFKNIWNKNSGLAYEFPSEIDFDAVISLNPKDPIDNSII